MAISRDTTAVVAAQLTVAWSNLYAARQGVGGLSDAQLAARIADIYESFRSAVGEVDVTHPIPPKI